MENKEILEGNKLIAEFDGWILTDEFPDKNRTYTKNGNLELDTTFKYHTSWDWLMPVVDKIEKKGCIIEISYSIVCMCRICIIGKKYEKAFNIINDNNGGIQPISAVYKSIVEFIKWYNQNNNV